MERAATAEMDPQSSSTLAPEQFLKFSGLPTEIRLQIWKLALPDPYSIHGAIPFILNLDLYNPYAILPSARETKQFFHAPWAVARYQRYGSDPEYSILLEMLDQCMSGWRAVFSLLHTCRASREIALATYRLDLESTIETENIPLWTSDDIVYFPWEAHHGVPLEAHLNWFFQGMTNPHPSLTSLQHAAFLFRTEMHSSLALWDGIQTPEAPVYHWAKHFPSLQSFSLFLDPCKVCYYGRGKILLYEPEDVPVEDVGGLTPSQIVQRMTAGLRRPGMKDEDVPLAEIFVVALRKTKPRKAA